MTNAVYNSFSIRSNRAGIPRNSLVSSARNNRLLSSRIHLELGDDASDQRFRIELVGSLFSRHGFATRGCANYSCMAV